MASYTYNPLMIVDNGTDRMRFELGDTDIAGKEQTAALSDEEIMAVLNIYPDRWKRAKLALVESICRRFSYEVETKVGSMSLGLQARADSWKTMYAELKAECSKMSAPRVNPASINGSAYFHTDMHSNQTSSSQGGGGSKCI